MCMRMHVQPYVCVWGVYPCVGGRAPEAWVHGHGEDTGQGADGWGLGGGRSGARGVCSLPLLRPPRPLLAQLWDIGGQPRFRSMWERYCRGVSAIV